ncbi:SMC-Scp complex subunit ScpB [Chitinophaga lutea]
MEISQLIPHVEALIFAADRPLPSADILELLNNALAFLEDRATAEQVEAAIQAIQEKYNSEFYAFSVRESGGGYQFLTKKDYYQTVAQLNGEKFLKRLSTAALETLAIIAYKQPISKGEIEHIRGVSTDYSITKLLEKELIVISGRSEELPGKPLLYSTSKAFMDYFGLNSPADLPKLKEVFDDDFVPPTQLTIDSASAEPEEDLHLAVSENGELTETITVTMDDELPEGGEPTEEHEADSPEAAVAEVSDEAESEGGELEINELDVEQLEADEPFVSGGDDEDEDEDDDEEDDDEEEDEDEDDEDEDIREEEYEESTNETDDPKILPYEDDPYDANDEEKEDEFDAGVEDDADDVSGDADDDNDPEDEEGREGQS